MDEGTNIVMVNSAEEVLLYLRDDKPTIKFPNTWCLPGGYLEEGEQPHECIRREIEEEMAWCSPPRRCARWSRPSARTASSTRSGPKWT